MRKALRWAGLLVFLSHLMYRRRGAVGVESPCQFLGDNRSSRGFDRGALHQVDELAVAQDGDGGRSGRVAGEVAAGLLGGLAVLAGEDSDGLVGLGAVLHSDAN